MEVEGAESRHAHRHAAKRSRVAGGGAGEAGAEGGEREAAVRGFGVVPWQHPASRIYRVSRASGGKDRHSKVYTAKGIRDRRVRLSVATAIQFYDLQDRLGYDQPSKAIEWLIKAASAAIDKLPSLEGAFAADGPKPLVSDEKLLLDGVADAGGGGQQLTRSGCSSTSETSKGSVLSLSRSESRVKARERARERNAAKDKEADDGRSSAATGASGGGAAAQTASFTELLTGMAAASGNGPAVAAAMGNSGHKHPQPWQLPAATVANDYFGGLVQSRKAAGQAMPPGFSSPTAHFSSVPPLGIVPAQPFNFGTAAAAATAVGEQHQEMTQFSFLQDHFMPVNVAAASAPAGDYSLNFSISSGLVGVNRGTLQSNSPSHFSSHQQLQRLSTPLDAHNIPFYFSHAAAAPAPAESQFSEAAAAVLQLWDGFRHPDMKEKGKN